MCVCVQGASMRQVFMHAFAHCLIDLLQTYGNILPVSTNYLGCLNFVGICAFLHLFDSSMDSVQTMHYTCTFQQLFSKLCGIIREMMRMR
jgi:hypothetical protein